MTTATIFRTYEQIVTEAVDRHFHGHFVTSSEVDEIELPGEETLSVRVEVDDISAIEHINGCDAYGRVAWPKRDRNTGRDIRPPGFDGAAFKLHPQGWHISDPIWWQPPGPDIVGDEPWTAEQLESEKRHITRLLADGFILLGVNDNWLGGIDSDPWSTEPGNADYLRQCVVDLACENVDDETRRYVQYAAACEDENLDPHDRFMWIIHGEPCGPLGS